MRSCSYSSGAARNCSAHAASRAMPTVSLSSSARHSAVRATTAVERVEHVVDLERRRVGLGAHALLHQVPVGVAGERDRAQRGAGGVAVEREEEGPFERWCRRAAGRGTGSSAPRTPPVTRCRRARRCAGAGPPSIGCSTSTRCANAWRVDTAAPSRSSSAVAARVARTGSGSPATCSSSRRMRSRSSDAAFSVNVTATISRMGTSATVINATTRSTSDLVLPDPAPASTNIVSSRHSTMARRAAASADSSFDTELASTTSAGPTSSTPVRGATGGSSPGWSNSDACSSVTAAPPRPPRRRLQHRRRRRRRVPSSYSER